MLNSTPSSFKVLVLKRDSHESSDHCQTSSASCLVASEDFIFCGCADGVVRVFSPSNLQYITTLPRPHKLGVELIRSEQHRYEYCRNRLLPSKHHCTECICVHSSPLPASPGDRYPHALALTFDPTAKHLTCVYNDHSIYVWDVHDVRSVRKLYSALYHSSSVWSIEVSISHTRATHLFYICFYRLL